MLLRAKLDFNIRNDWVGKDLEEMAYVDKFGRNDHGAAFLCQENGGAFRPHVKYARGVVVKGDIRERRAELQIGRVAARKDILERQLAEGIFPMR